MSWPHTRRRRVGKYFHRSAPETDPRESVKKFFFVCAVVLAGTVLIDILAVMH